MDENELAEIRKQKLEQFRQQQEAQAQREQQVAEAKGQIEGALRHVLSQDAWDQWNNARFGNEGV